MSRLRQAFAAAAFGAAALTSFGVFAQVLDGPPPPPPFAIPATPGAPSPPATGTTATPKAEPVSAGPTVETAIIVRDVVFAFGPATLKAPRIEILGARQSADEIAAALRAKDVAEARQRLRAFSARQVSAPRVTLSVDVENVRSQTDYVDVRLDDVADGRIGAASARAVAVEMHGAGDDVVAEMSGVSAERVDVAAALAIMFDAAPAGSAPLDLYGPFKIERYAVSSKAGETQMQGVTGGPARMTPGETPLIDVLTAIMRLKPDSDGPEQVTPMLKAARGLIAGMELAHARVETIEFKPKAGEESGVVVRLDGMWMRDMRRGLVSFGVEAMQVDSKNAATTAKAIELIDYDQLSVLDAVINMLSDPKAVSNLNPVTLIPKFGRVELGSLVSCKEAREECSDEAADFMVEGAALERASVGDGIDWRFDVKRFRTPASGDAPAAKGGWSSLVEWRPQGRSLSLREARLKIEGFGEASLSTAFENVLPDIFSGNRISAMIALTPMAARRAALRLVDDGAVAKLIAAEAKSTTPAKGVKAPAKPLSPAAARDALAKRIERETLTKGDAPALKTLANALGGFVRDPSAPLTLTITAEPAIGALDLVAAKAPDFLLRRLNIAAERK